MNIGEFYAKLITDTIHELEKYVKTNKLDFNDNINLIVNFCVNFVGKVIQGLALCVKTVEMEEEDFITTRNELTKHFVQCLLNSLKNNEDLLLKEKRPN